MHSALSAGVGSMAELLVSRGGRRMLIGVPKETKNHEYRVGLTPESVGEVTALDCRVLVEHGAGAGIDASDALYEKAGAEIVAGADEVFERADLIVKVKEPQAGERKRLRAGQVLFTYLHLAADPEQTKDLMASGSICIAYETVTDSRGGLPLLKPMSQVAGRMAIQAGATALEKAHGGRGILLGGVPGVNPGKVLIIGGGVAGFHAAQMAVGLQANVVILDRDAGVLERLADHFNGRARVRYSTRETIKQEVRDADLVVGAVLIPGAAAPKLVSKSMLQNMQPGAVLVDVAIDQGGCFETSRPTSHAKPTYIVDGIVHYCVTNMPGALARTSTYALNNATLPYVLDLAGKGARSALLDDPHLRRGLNIWHGAVTCEPVAKALGHRYVSQESVLSA
jgi:alanine dehydrogenase